MTSSLSSCTSYTEGCSPALEGARWKSHLKSTLLNTGRETAAKDQSACLNFLLAGTAMKEEGAASLLCLLEVSNWNQSREALSGLLSVYGVHLVTGRHILLVTNHSDSGNNIGSWLQHLSTMSYSSELHPFFNNFTARSRCLFTQSRPTVVTCKNESHLPRKCWRCPTQLKSFGSKSKNA